MTKLTFKDIKFESHSQTWKMAWARIARTYGQPEVQ